MQEEIKAIAKKYALQNAVKFEGKASMGAVLGRVLSQNPDFKKDMQLVRDTISEVLKEVNALDVNKQKFLLTTVAPELVGEQPKKKREGLKDLPKHPSGETYTLRFAPSPSGPLHIGHAYVLLLNYLYTQKYKGKFLLRLEDTNPDNIFPDAYEMIPRDANWLTKDGVSQVIVQSDRMELYYMHAVRLLDEGHAYVCLCPSETFRELANAKEACPCRGNDVQENLKRWKGMQTAYQQGQAVVRFKTDITHKNPAMRDFPLLRINDTPHPRQGKKYRIWPLMNFSVAIDDMDLGVTHALRGKDHADNAKRQAFIHEAFGVDTPVAVSVGRINFTGGDVEVSASKTKKLVEEGRFEGWDDIRLPFVGAMKRSGYTPEAFQKWVVDTGATLNDKTVAMNEFLKTINACNKGVIDPHAERYFFVQDPITVEVVNAPRKHIVMDKHPDNKKGGRTFETTETFYLAQKDLDDIKEGELCRLVDCFNITKEGEAYVYASESYDEFKENGKKIIHWLPKKEDVVHVSVRMSDNTIVTGFGEDEIAELDVGAMVQFERFGFCRLDNFDGNSYNFWFCHR